MTRHFDFSMLGLREACPLVPYTRAFGKSRWQSLKDAYQDHQDVCDFIHTHSSSSTQRQNNITDKVGHLRGDIEKRDWYIEYLEAELAKEKAAKRSLIEQCKRLHRRGRVIREVTILHHHGPVYNEDGTLCEGRR